jgi:peroxiredoxin
MAFPSRNAIFPAVAALLLLTSAPAFAEEKTLTPLGGGIPMIEGIQMLAPGKDAPDFTIKDTEGKAFTFSTLKAGKRPAVLVFWSIFCEPCRFEMPFIQKMYDRYKEKGLDVVSIALDGEPLKNSIAGFVKQEGYSFRVLIDELDENEAFKVSDPYGVGGTPTLFVVDRAGKVTFSRAGRVKDEDIEKAITAVVDKK